MTQLLAIILIGEWRYVIAEETLLVVGGTQTQVSAFIGSRHAAIVISIGRRVAIVIK